MEGVNLVLCSLSWTVGEDVALEAQSSAPITAGRPIIAALSKPGQNPGGARGID
jgi:hypothetical protein